MKSQKIIARTFGVFFLLAFLSYGLGSGLVNSIAGATDSLINVNTNKTPLIIGVILMALIHTIVNIGLPVLMVPILKPYNKFLSYGYLSAGIAATVTLIIGAIFLMLLVPLSAMYVKADAADLLHFETIATILIKGNDFAYQIGMAIWGLGGLMFCHLLFISKLVPKGLAIWGFLAYIVFISGTILELFGNNVGVQLAIPGGLFEITLSIWLIVKGFNVSRLMAAE
jgi:hypothetical protein